MFVLSLPSVDFYVLIWFSFTGSVSAKCPLGPRLKRAPLGEVVFSLCFSCAVVLESGLTQMCSFI